MVFDDCTNYTPTQWKQLKRYEAFEKLENQDEEEQ
jgi:hypothetical protein